MKYDGLIQCKDPRLPSGMHRVRAVGWMPKDQFEDLGSGPDERWQGPETDLSQTLGLQTPALFSRFPPPFLYFPKELLPSQNLVTYLVAQWSRICLQCRRHRRHGFDPWVGKNPWRRKWQPTPKFLPGQSHAQSSEPDRLPTVESQRVRHD